MTTLANIVSETGLDLGDPKLVETVLAPAFGKRLASAFPFVEQATEISTSLMQAYRSLTATNLSVAGVYKLAISTVKAAASFLEGRLDEAISDNFSRLETARNKTVEKFVKPGDWSIAVPAGGRAVGKVDGYNNAGGWDEAQFLAQYNPGIVWMSHRPAKSDILLPTWPSPPFTNGFGFMSAEKGYKFPAQSPLTGVVRHKPGGPLGVFLQGQPSIGPIPQKYNETYFGTMPASSDEELAERHGDYATRLKALERLIQKMETAFYIESFLPPPDYTYLFSIGTYPFTSWSSAAGNPMASGSEVVLNGTMAALAAGIHSFTPLHAAVDSSAVERCYRAWSRTAQLQSLPPLPKAQLDDRVYRDELGLPYSANKNGLIYFVASLPKGAKQDATLPDGRPLPAGLGTSYALNWEVVKAIEMSFRSFFKIRRAAVYQMALTPPEFRPAALLSRDPILRAAAQGKVPTYRPWSEADPLGVLGGAKEVGFVPPSKGLGKKRSSGGGAFVAVGLLGLAGAGIYAATRGSGRGRR